MDGSKSDIQPRHTRKLEDSLLDRLDAPHQAEDIAIPVPISTHSKGTWKAIGLSKCRVTGVSARLARAFNTTPELWLNLQRTYDLWQAAHKSDTWHEVETLVAVPYAGKASGD